jgi:protease I
MPLPAADFDPTESAIPWKLLEREGVPVRFATPMGEPAHADRRMLTGEGLGPFAPLLRARVDAVDAYRAMAASGPFLRPLPYAVLDAADFDGLILPGGHAPGMRVYLESRPLQALVVAFFAAGKPVGAICHGVLLAARSIDPRTGRSVLYHRRTTALLRSQELFAWRLSALWTGRYYRTYDATVEDEVISHLAHPSQFAHGPFPLWRDDESHPGRGFTVRDARYLSARWPGDAHRFALDFLSLLRSVR